MADDNPFDNPFGEQPKPVSAPANNSSNVNVGGVLDGYNPYTAPIQQPSQVAQNATGLPPSGSDDLYRKQRELEDRARELDEREAELRRLQAQGGANPNNFPPLPSIFPCKPCFYIDIPVQIPVEFQQLVTNFQRLWYLYSGLMAVNFIISLAYLCAASENFATQAGGTFGISIAGLLFAVPLAFVCWFRPIYKAFQNDSSLNFFIFFIVFGTQTLVNCLQAIGIDNVASGIWNGAIFTKANMGVGIIMVLMGIAFAGLTAIDVFLLLKVHKIYKASGATLAKAQTEFSTGVVQNKNVQQFAAQAATSAAQNVATGGVPRY